MNMGCDIVTINDVIEKVLNGIKDEWTILEKIRYVYVTVGKYLQKDTDFFFSVDKKLAEKNLSFKEIKEIYEDTKTEGDLKVICRSAAYILQRIYDRLNIKSELVKSNNNVIDFSSDNQEIEINHWFLAVYDEEKAYFLTLASDLPYIQMGMQTKHFASNIPYKKVQKNGEEIQVYMGDEIKHIVLTDKELRDIDLKIGYINNIYQYDEKYQLSKKNHYNYNDASLAMLSHELKGNKLYIDMEEKNTRFYHRLAEVELDGEKRFLYEIEKENFNNVNWDVWVRRLCKYINRRVEQIVEYRMYLSYDFYDPNWKYETWLNEICLQIQRYLFKFIPQGNDELFIGNDFVYNKWSRKMKNALKETYDVFDVDNLFLILDKTNTLVSSIKSNKQNPNFNKIFSSLSYHFIPKSNLLETSMIHDNVSSRYITHKFKRLFKKIFGCNREVRSFNKLEYSEQIVIIKMIIDKMFPELNKTNASLDDTYNDNYSVVQNRIQIYAVKNKQTGDYALVFHIVGDESFGDTYYFYNPKANTFNTANILQIYTEYILVSDRLKTRIEEMEEIETIKKNKR